MSIDVLMATYEGERFLAAQLDSIFAQTYSDWQLFVSDDGSKDGTFAILEEYAARYPKKMSIRRNLVNSGSSAANFMGMLSLSKADYVMFSDQDDVWLPKKMEAAHRAIVKMEKRYGKNVPLLVHSDLTVVDESLHTKYPSMFALQKLSASNWSFARQLAQNCVTGCTVIVNRALLNRLTVLPEHPIMHDWWIALVAACFGKIGFIKTPYILYRMHGGNVEGAKDYSSVRATLRRAKKTDAMLASINKTYRQAEAFRDIYEDELQGEAREIVTQYLRMEDAAFPKKMVILFRFGFWKTGWNRKAGQIWALFLSGKGRP